MQVKSYQSFHFKWVDLTLFLTRFETSPPTHPLDFFKQKFEIMHRLKLLFMSLKIL